MCEQIIKLNTDDKKNGDVVYVLEKKITTSLKYIKIDIGGKKDGDVVYVFENHEKPKQLFGISKIDELINKFI